ncbi:hypothetical protein BDW62DRAFT_207161 [Aspergillus aurantiobrunneus]
MRSIQTVILALLAATTVVNAAQYCGGEALAAPVDAAQDCVNYLREKGDQSCEFNGKSIEFCYSHVGGGKTSIVGANWASGFTKTTCNDVADAAQVVIDDCQKDGKTRGEQPAPQHREMRVLVQYDPEG